MGDVVEFPRPVGRPRRSAPLWRNVLGDVLRSARHVTVLRDGVGMSNAFPKTSGATGLQIYVPLEPGR